MRLLNTVPSVLGELLRKGPLPASVRTVALAGEALPRALADQVHALGTVPRLLDLYGPSEDTTYSTGAEVEAGDARPPAIGNPLPGGRAFVRLKALPLTASGKVERRALPPPGSRASEAERPYVAATRCWPLA